MFNMRIPFKYFRRWVSHTVRGREKRDTASAITHNALDHVNNLNQNQKHWNKCRKCDAKFIERAYPHIVTLCEIDNQSRVADIGCGTGVLVDKLTRDYPSAHVMGYDFSEQKVMQCVRYYKHSNFAVGSVYDDLEEKYDVLVLTEVLEHLERPGWAVKNCFNHLRSNGRMLFTVPNGRIDTYVGHINFWSPESWAIFIKECMAEERGVVCVETGLVEGRNYALVKRG